MYVTHKMDSIPFNNAFMPLFRAINSYDPDFKMPDLTYDPVERLHYVDGERKLIMFNGDIASTACAMMFKNRDVELFYIGDNDKVISLANMLDIKIHVENPKPILGKGFKTDKSIFRGVFKINKALEYALANGYSTNILTGYIESPRHTFHKDVLDAYEKVIQIECPDFHIAKPLPNIDIAKQEVKINKKIFSYIIENTDKAST